MLCIISAICVEKSKKTNQCECRSEGGVVGCGGNGVIGWEKEGGV